MATRINIDLTNEANDIKRLRLQNEQNKTNKAVYDSKIEAKKEYFKELFKEYPDLEKEIDIERLTDKVYVKAILAKLLDQFEKLKDELNFNIGKIEEAQR